MVNRTTLSHLRVVRANVAVAAAAVGAAAVLLTGCGHAAVPEPVDPGGKSQREAARSCPAYDPAAPVSADPAAPTSTDSAAPTSAPTTIDGTPGNTPEAEHLAQAVGEQGRGAFADVYSTLIVDQPAGRVALCVTDLERGRLLVQAAHAADPQADPARADLYLSAYTRKTLDATADKLIVLKADFPIYSVSGDHGALVEVTTNQEGSASPEFKAQLEKAAGGVPVTVVEGPQPIAGDALMTAAP